MHASVRIWTNHERGYLASTTSPSLCSCICSGQGERPAKMKRVSRGRGFLATVPSLVSLLSLVKISVGFGSKKDIIVVADFPAAVTTNRCSDLDLSGFANAMNCGPPLSAPCFDFARCRNSATVYVYDHQVCRRTPPPAVFVAPLTTEQIGGKRISALARAM